MRPWLIATFAVLQAAAAAAGSKPSPTPPPPPRRIEAVRVALKAPARPVEELEAALASEDEDVRAEAAWELAGAGSVSESVSNRLHAVLQDDPDPRVRAGAAWALGHLHKGLGPAESQLQSMPYDEPPRLVQQVGLVYPDAAFAQRIEGTVRVEFVIDEEGRVVHAEARESVPAFDEAAVGAVLKWRFAPAKLGGKPIATMASAPVAFTITRK